NQSENDCHVVEKEYDKVENSKLIAPGLFKLSVSQSVSPISMSKTSCDSKNVEKSETSSSFADDKISEVSYYLSESEYETLEYYDNTTTYGLFVNDNDSQEIFHDCENFPENLIESQINHNESAIDHNDSKRIDKLI
nr:hypothetical protein [Tanacetum cinerariifolium]